MAKTLLERVDEYKKGNTKAGYLNYGELRERANLNCANIGIGRPLDELLGICKAYGLPLGITLFVAPKNGGIDYTALERDWGVKKSGALRLRKETIDFDWSSLEWIETDSE